MNVNMLQQFFLLDFVPILLLYMLDVYIFSEHFLLESFFVYIIKLKS